MTSSSLNLKIWRAMFLSLLTVVATAIAAPPTTATTLNSPPMTLAPLQHGPVSSTPAGISVPVSVAVADAEEILEVRLYFKTMAAPDYLFLPMAGSSKGIFTASLPPAKNDTRGIDYLLLFKSSRGETRKTKPFRLLVLNDYNVPPPLPGEFEVLTEQSAPEEENRDFAVPLQLTTSPEPLLVYAVEDPSPPQVTRGSDGNRDVFDGLSDFSGVSFSIKIGGVGFFYKGFSGR
jgi:hypothetical protein